MKTFLLTSFLLLSFENSFAASAAIETCFSPGEGCDKKLIDAIDSAKETLDVAIYSIAHEGIAKSIIAAKKRGVKVRMVVDKDQAAAKYSETGSLVESKVPLKIGNVSGIMHHKYTIIDGDLLETGSFNYSNNATSSNAENQIYIKDAKVIKKFQDDFESLWADGLKE